MEEKEYNCEDSITLDPEALEDHLVIESKDNDKTEGSSKKESEREVSPGLNIEKVCK